MLPHPESQFLEASTLFVEARFRGRVVAARLLGARTARPFTIGAARRADAPVDPAFLPADAPANDNHALIARSGAGFVVNLSPAMRRQASLGAHGLRIPCGEVVFDIREAAPEPTLPRPWFARAWRAELPYSAGVGAVLLLALALLHAVPSDPHALSLDDVGRTVRFDVARVVPPTPVVPPTSGGGAAASAAAVEKVATAGRAGDLHAPRIDARRSRRGEVPVARDANAAAEQVRRSPLLALLDEPRSASLASVLARGGALGSEADDVLGQLVATNIDRAFGNGGLDALGTGAAGADTGHGLLGRGPVGLNLAGIGGRPGAGGSFGRDVGRLGALPRPKAHDITLDPGKPLVRGGLDKEIVRRVVRQHLNEVRFCYSEALARQPSLAGRVVVQFTIAPTGRVIAAALQSSSLGAAGVEQCIVAATKRWPYPQPEGGGLVVVSYPFQLVAAGL
jgi:TonB family protein